MNVLWASLVAFPPLCEKLGMPIPASCGWLWSSAKSVLKMMPDFKMGVIVFSKKMSYEKYVIDGVSYYTVPCKSIEKTDRKQVASCKKAIDDFQPDLIHIHGTEHSLALAICEANFGTKPIIASIQGLATGYVKYADGGLRLTDKILNITPLDFYRNTFLFRAKESMATRARTEQRVLRQLTDIIGRTQWDHDHVVSINPNIRYHFMNETLRDSFYDDPFWNYDNCKKHTIFVSNSGVPLKGAHQVLKALPIILQKYPDTQVSFCGSSVMSDDWRTKIHFQGYHLYLRRLVKKMGLQEHVKFLGGLSESQMKQAFLEANVYVLPSAIENSPNSLCEAQILGVPIIASYVGGVPTLIKEGDSGYLYRYEEVCMLAQLVLRLFEKDDYLDLSQNERITAIARHDRNTNAKRLIEIYQSTSA